MRKQALSPFVFEKSVSRLQHMPADVALKLQLAFVGYLRSLRRRDLRSTCAIRLVCIQKVLDGIGMIAPLSVALVNPIL